MKVRLTIAVFCGHEDADLFEAIGFEAVTEDSTGKVSLLHTSATREHAASVAALARAEVVFYGFDEGDVEAAPALFAAADGVISYAMRVPGFDDPAVFVSSRGDVRNLDRAVEYHQRLERAKKLMQTRSASNDRGGVLVN